MIKLTQFIKKFNGSFGPPYRTPLLYTTFVATDCDAHITTQSHEYQNSCTESHA